MTQELHKLKTQLDDSERDRSWLLNELARTQTTTELLASRSRTPKLNGMRRRPRNRRTTGKTMIARLSSSYRRASGRRNREEKAEIAKRRKQKVQVAHQVADRIKSAALRAADRRGTRPRAPADGGEPIPADGVLEAVLAVSRERTCAWVLMIERTARPPRTPRRASRTCRSSSRSSSDRWTACRATMMTGSWPCRRRPRRWSASTPRPSPSPSRRQRRRRGAGIRTRLRTCGNTPR